MKTQITLGILIFAGFVGWLFFQTTEWLEIRNRELSIENERIQMEGNRSKYTIINIPDGMTYLLNKKNGTTWRWYRNITEGEIESEGWTPVNFNVLSYDFPDAESARQANKRLTDALREMKLGTSTKENETKEGSDPATLTQPESETPSISYEEFRQRYGDVKSNGTTESR